MNHVLFVCPSCHSNRLKEIQTGCTAVSDITLLHLDQHGPAPTVNVSIDCDESTLSGGRIDRYLCTDCGYVLRNKRDEPISSRLELAAWLQDHEAPEALDLSNQESQ